MENLLRLLQANGGQNNAVTPAMEPFLQMLSQRFDQAKYRNIGPSNLTQFPDRNSYMPQDVTRYRNSILPGNSIISGGDI